MSETTIRKRVSFDNVLTDPTTIKLSDPTATFGVKRSDTDATVVADATAMTQVSTGIYEHTFTDPADGLTYEYWLEIVYAGETYRIEGTIAGGSDGSENIYNLLPRIETLLRGPIQDDFLKQQLREATRRFFLDTEIWELSLDTITSVADQKDYTLTTSYDAEIHRVIEVKYEDVRVNYKTVSVDGLTLTLSSTPTSSGDDIDVKVVLIPKETCTDVEVHLLSRWGQGVMYAALTELRSMPDRPWTNPDAAVMDEIHYNRVVGQARREKETARGIGNTRVRIPDFI